MRAQLGRAEAGDDSLSSPFQFSAERDNKKCANKILGTIATPDVPMEKEKSRLVFPNLEEDIVKVVDLIFRTQRAVACVRETHAQSFVLIRNVVHVPLGPCHRVRTNSVHIEEGERAETVSGQTGHQ